MVEGRGWRRPQRSLKQEDGLVSRVGRPKGEPDKQKGPPSPPSLPSRLPAYPSSLPQITNLPFIYLGADYVQG